MKKINLILAVFLFMGIVFNACKKDKDEEPSPTPTVSAPVASFNVTGDGQVAPCNVTFTNTSTNATSYKWDFGDGATSNEKSPVHTFNVGGVYKVILTAKGDGGESSFEKTITINTPIAQPVASYNYSGAGGYAPCAVSFSNSSQNAISYKWDFGDGKTSSSVNPTHTFTSGGVFTVTLTAYNSVNQSNTTSKTINILTPPTIVKIKKINVTQMPMTDSDGTSWDYSNGPDLYVDIYKGTTMIDTFEDYGKTDVTSFPVTFSYTNGLNITDLSANYYIKLYDNDSPDADDFIGTCGPFIFNTLTSYPSTVSKTTNGISVTLEIQWQ